MASKNEIVVRAGVGVAGIAVVVTGASSAAASTATVLLSGGAALALAAIGFGIYRLLQPPERRDP